MMNTVQPNYMRGFMGVKERQEREREAVSRAILDAARALFVEEGYPNVSMRKIAERIEYSPAAIYGYFPSKDDIFFALAEEGFRLLCSGGANQEPSADPLDDLRNVFWNVYAFSRSHPEYYALMFTDRSVPRISRDWERFAFVHDMKLRVIAMIQRAIDDGAFPAGTPADAVFSILLVAINGVAVMRLCDRLAPGADADALAHDTLEAALGGLRAGIVHTFKPGPCVES
jgi:AcrR family transcriptional regulator